MFGCFLSFSFSPIYLFVTLFLYGGIVEVDSVLFDKYYCYYYYCYYYYLGSSTWI